MEARITEYKFDEDGNQTVKSVTTRTPTKDSSVSVKPAPRYYVLGGLVYWTGH